MDDKISIYTSYYISFPLISRIKYFKKYGNNKKPWRCIFITFSKNKSKKFIILDMKASINSQNV